MLKVSTRKGHSRSRCSCVVSRRKLANPLEAKRTMRKSLIYITSLKTGSDLAVIASASVYRVNTDPFSDKQSAKTRISKQPDARSESDQLERARSSGY